MFLVWEDGAAAGKVDSPELFLETMITKSCLLKTVSYYLDGTFKNPEKGGLGMRNIFIAFFLVLACAALVSAESGLINVKSAHDVTNTADRLESVLKEKGMTVFIRINHTEGARNVGKKLRPTELVIFGNPKVGTPLMQCGQTVAIDLPQKALIWQDENGQVWLTYNDPQYLAGRHGIDACKAVVGKVQNALKNFAQAATQP